MTIRTDGPNRQEREGGWNERNQQVFGSHPMAVFRTPVGANAPRLEWILRIQAEGNTSQLLRDAIDVPVNVQRHRLKITISAFEIGTFA